MRTLIALTAGIILLSVATTSLAEDRTGPNRDQVRRVEQRIFHESTHAMLTGSPYFRDIQRVNDQAEETEQRLLAQLKISNDDLEVARIVNRLEHLEVDRELSVLKIQARYAHRAGMLDLEMKIRARILDILEQD
jgi:hypothetical protein